jgi:hypothetical protein
MALPWEAPIPVGRDLDRYGIQDGITINRSIQWLMSSLSKVCRRRPGSGAAVHTICWRDRITTRTLKLVQQDPSRV